MKENYINVCRFYAVSPIHAGSGMSTGAVDLPIQRERHTNWPHVQASAVKGSMRAAFRERNEDRELINIIFGSDDQDDWDKEYKKNFKDSDSLPGALSVSDAKLLAFPMRSNIAPFVWVSSPAVLERFNRDMELAGLESLKVDIPELKEKENAAVYFNTNEKSILLEDIVVNAAIKEESISVGKFFNGIDKLVVVSDQVYKHCVDSCTEVQTQIKIDSKTGTAQNGALRYIELLPSDSLLYSIVNIVDSPYGESFKAKTILDTVISTIKDFIQIGGESTLGRGICKISWEKEN